jgi:hypothetical protein
MKKWIMLIVSLLMVGGVQAAAKYPMTKEQYLAARQKRAEKKGQEFKQAKEEKKFNKMDANSDGVLSEEEAAAAKAASDAKKAEKTVDTEE